MAAAVSGSERLALFRCGLDHIRAFCAANALECPDVRLLDIAEWPFPQTCAYYRPHYIAICVERCAHPGYGGRAWSWPGYAVDRTPYGVLAHELGHAVDVHLSQTTDRYRGDFSADLRRTSGAPALTGYASDDGEWFAEWFRLYVTNPDLVRALAPALWAQLQAPWRPVETRPWQEVLATAPERTRRAAENRIAVASRQRRNQPSLPLGA